jgi:SAM-dependent methyltransferase
LALNYKPRDSPASRAHRAIHPTPESLASDDPTITDFTYAFAHWKNQVTQLIIDRRVRTVCEVGGGRSPAFTVQEVVELGLDYTVIDVSAAELALTSSEYKKIQADICHLEPARLCAGAFDLVFSQMLAEHVTSGEAMHRSIYKLLRPGGVAFHFFPTLFSPAFVANRVLPDSLAHMVLTALHRGRTPHVKFPARYSWCFGPSPHRVTLFNRLGYRVLEYRPFYGTAYLRFVPIGRQLEDAFHKAVARLRSRWFTSYAWVILLKPSDGYSEA